MSKKPVLVVMAAGMGSRYGGLKQIDPVGNCGEAILDYSLYDAHEAGFETAVIVIKEAIKKDFMDTVGKRLQNAPIEIPIYNKERAIIQFILRHGEKQLLVPENAESDTPAFTETVISNIHYSIVGDGIQFSHPLYKKIFEEAATHGEEQGFVAEKYFLAHPDAEISRLTAELCNDRYMLSKAFAENTNEERNETAVLFEQATRLVISYKQSLVDEMLKETMRQLKNPETMQNAELANEVMQNYKFLKETQQALNNLLKSYGFGECALNI